MAERPWWDGRCVVRRPDVPGHLDVSSLQLIRSEEERAEIQARIDAAVDAEAARADRWPYWLADRPGGTDD